MKLRPTLCSASSVAAAALFLFPCGTLTGCRWLRLFSHRSSRDQLEETAAREAGQQRARTAAKLAAIRQARTAGGANDLVSIALSQTLIGGMVSAFDGAKFTDRDNRGTLTLKNLRTRFGEGSPRISATLTAEIPGHGPEDFQAEATLESTISADANQVDLRLLLLAIESRRDLPAAIQTLISGEAIAALNAKLPALTAPLPSVLKIPATASKLTDAPLKLGDARVIAQVTFPELPEIALRWQAVDTWFDVDGLHALGRISATSAPFKPYAPVAPAAASGSPADDASLTAEFTPYRLPEGSDYQIRIPAQPFADIVTTLSARPGEARRVTAQGVSVEGRIVEKGNIKVQLDDPASLRAVATASDLHTVWQEGKGLQLVSSITAAVTAKVSAEAKKAGNLTLSTRADATSQFQATTLLSYNPEAAAFTLKLEQPNVAAAKISVGALINATVALPLPLGRELYHFKLPGFAARDFTIRMPKGVTPETKSFQITLQPPAVTFASDSLELHGMAPLEQKPAADGK